MPRFIYNANGLAIGGRITWPFDQFIECHAGCVLPSTGGRAATSTGPYRLKNPETGDVVLSFDSAETVTRGDEQVPGTFTTVVSSWISGLNVLNVLAADEISLKLTLTYELESHRVAVDTTGSRFTNLTIAGEAFDIRFDHPMSQAAGDYEKFRKLHPELHESHGRVLYSLARHEDLKFDNEDFGYRDVPDFGRIYFAEWTAAPRTQSMTMLRLRLGSPLRGAITLAGGLGNGGPF